MFCTNCGGKLPENAGFCGNCGARTAIPAPVSAVHTNATPKKSRHSIIAVVVLAVVLVGVAYFFFSGNEGAAHPLVGVWEFDEEAFVFNRDGTMNRVVIYSGFTVPMWHSPMYWRTEGNYLIRQHSDMPEEQMSPFEIRGEVLLWDGMRLQRREWPLPPIHPNVNEALQSIGRSEQSGRHEVTDFTGMHVDDVLNNRAFDWQYSFEVVYEESTAHPEGVVFRQHPMPGRLVAMDGAFVDDDARVSITLSVAVGN